MIQCPFCDVRFESTTSAIHHAIAFPDGHRIDGLRIESHPRNGDPDQYAYYCWCSAPYFYFESLVEHMMVNGGFRQHAINLLLGVELEIHL